MSTSALPWAQRSHNRQVFVGRQVELERIHAAFDAATDDTDPAARSEGSRQLEAAISELRAMHMRPSLERALGRRAETLVAVDALSRREREIAGLLAGGMSNRAIADALVIRETTVEVHVKHILNKLHVKSRTQVATWFARHAELQHGKDRS